MKTSTLLLLSTVAVAALLSSADATPGHMNIPYYQKQKAEREAKQMRDLYRDCRNSRNMDPKCQRVYSSSSPITSTLLLVVSAAIFGGRGLWSSIG